MHTNWIHKCCACKCAYLLGLGNKWETCLPLKTSVSIMQTKYEILIYRKQVFLHPVLYINEFIYSYCLQTKYVCIGIFLEVYFLQHTILNWQKKGVRKGDPLPSLISYLYAWKRKVTLKCMRTTWKLCTSCETLFTLVWCLMLSCGFCLLQRFRAGSSSLYPLRVDSWFIPFTVMVLWWVRNRALRVT